MRPLFRILFLLALIIHGSHLVGQNVALLLIDVQEFYFPGGRMQLENADMAGMNAGLLLDQFRNVGFPVYHVRHNFEPGGDIHEDVKPIEGEMIISKDEVNAFNGSELKAFLEDNEITQVVLVGMQTYMCLEGTTRAAYDMGYDCIVIGDACATKDLEYGNTVIKAADVHYATLITLESYAKVITTQEFLAEEK